MTLTSRLVDHVRGLTFARLPDEARTTARHVVLDGVAVTLAGVTEPLGVGRIITDHVRASAGPPQASVVGGGFLTSMADAAFANGTMAHALDFDNTWYPMNHPTSATLPAVLAVAEHFGLTGRDCVVAMVAAFEVQARLRLASTGMRTGRGFHKPGTTGLMGAVAACIKLLDLDAKKAEMAFGIAGSRVGSLSINTGTMTKSSHAGHAARMGLESALLADRGWTASPDVFGPTGYFDTLFGDEHESELLVKDFAAPLWMVSAGVGFKRFPSNYFTHRPIDAALLIRAQPGFEPSSIETVTVTFPDLRYVNRPEPRSGLDGKFSVQYTTLVALLDGKVTIDSFTDARRFADDVVDLLPAVSVRHDSSISPELLDMHVDVTARLRGGEEFTQRVSQFAGMPGVPLTARQRMHKFADCAERVLEPDSASNLAQLLERIDELTDIRDVMKIARSDGSMHRHIDRSREVEGLVAEPPSVPRDRPRR